MRTLHVALAAILTWPSLTAGQAGQAPDAARLAARVQARYAAVKDFQGDFVQGYEGGVLRTRTTERGTIAVKQPGRFRFVYTKPERKEFVSDGVRIYSYLVADKQVFVSPAPGPGEGTTPALFLAGQADIARDFTASFAPLPGAAEGLITLRLEPRTPDPDYQWFGIGIDPDSLQILHLVAADRNGGRSSFAFSNLQENRGLSDNMFRFRVPRGVEVVTNDTRSQ